MSLKIQFVLIFHFFLLRRESKVGTLYPDTWYPVYFSRANAPFRIRRASASLLPPSSRGAKTLGRAGGHIMRLYLTSSQLGEFECGSPFRSLCENRTEFTSTMKQRTLTDSYNFNNPCRWYFTYKLLRVYLIPSSANRDAIMWPRARPRVFAPPARWRKILWNGLNEYVWTGPKSGWYLDREVSKIIFLIYE